MSAFFTEADYEKSVIELFQNLGYSYIYAPEFERDYSCPVLESTLQDCLVKINKNLPYAAIMEAIGKLRDFDAGSLLQRNETFMNYLQNGIPVKYVEAGEERTNIVYLIDYDNVDHNDFCVLNQFTYIENGNNRRPDVIVFVNGLPLVVIELKSPSKDEVGSLQAWIALWSGRVRTAHTRTISLHNLKPSMRGCLRKSVFWISCKTLSVFRGTSIIKLKY